MTDLIDTNNHEELVQSDEEYTSRLNTANFSALSSHYPKINAFSRFIGWAIIFTVVLIASLLINQFNPHFIVLPTIAIFSLLSGLFGYYSAKACGYFKSDFDLLFKSGLWWKRQTALSFSRIQHIDISHGPLERKYNMATIKFFTAGGALSDLKIPGLPKEIAESLRTEILQYAKSEFESTAEKQSEPQTATESDFTFSADENKNAISSKNKHE